MIWFPFFPVGAPAGGVSLSSAWRIGIRCNACGRDAMALLDTPGVVVRSVRCECGKCYRVNFRMERPPSRVTAV